MNAELLTLGGMADARRALMAKYHWFIHMKPICKFESIKLTGLQPASQGCPTNNEVASAIGHKVKSIDEIICLRPLGDSVHDSTPYRGHTLITLAIPSTILPCIITLDWTNSYAWGLAPVIKADEPAIENALIFCEVVRRSGSVVIYEPIPPSCLKVLTKSVSPGDPLEWPSLTTTQCSDVAQFP